VDLLKAANAELAFAIEKITTTGDRQGGAILGEGIFVREIQKALLDGSIDVAVHSLKDLPTELVEGLRIAAIPQRADPREALVGGTLGSLRKGARVGTGSPRRSAQLRRLRDDLEVVPIRGNVPTRVEKARSGEFDAVLLACAGLERLGIDPDEILDPLQILPAPGQGALALETRDESGLAGDACAQIDDLEIRAAVDAERILLREMGGGCLLPVGAWGRIEEGRLLLDAAVVSADGAREARGHAEGVPSGAGAVARQLAEELKSQGAMELLEDGFQG
jgi:hydroxymethylbilane synthase